MLMALRAVCIVSLVSGCSSLNNAPLSHEELETLIENSQARYVAEISGEIVIFDNVGFGLGLPLRSYLGQKQNVNGKTILDLGAGTGVLSLIALKNGASRSVATDLNQYAVANAIYNAEHLGFKDKMEVRLVSMDKPGAYSVIEKNETFDLIVSNPPQGTMRPENIYDYSYADPGLDFLRSILEGLKEHLTTDGKGVFALYDQGLELAYQMAREHGFNVSVLLITYNKNGKYYLVAINHRQG
jgi:methylase of polypeptide subunit release factors